MAFTLSSTATRGWGGGGGPPPRHRLSDSQKNSLTQAPSPAPKCLRLGARPSSLLRCVEVDQPKRLVAGSLILFASMALGGPSSKPVRARASNPWGRVPNFWLSMLIRVPTPGSHQGSDTSATIMQCLSCTIRQHGFLRRLISCAAIENRKAAESLQPSLD